MYEWFSWEEEWGKDFASKSSRKWRKFEEEREENVKMFFLFTKVERKKLKKCNWVGEKKIVHFLTLFMMKSYAKSNHQQQLHLILCTIKSKPYLSGSI